MSILRAALEIGHVVNLAQTVMLPVVKIEFQKPSDVARFRLVIENDPELSRYQNARDMLNGRYVINGIVFEVGLK